MDYGQTTQQPANSDFFTSGAGTNDNQVNTFDSENNLDLSNQQANWGTPIERDQKNIGSQAINSINSNQPESGPTNNPNAMPVPNMPPMPEISPESLTEAPSGTNPSLNPAIIKQPDTDNLSADDLNIKKIKTSDRLSEESVKVVDEALAKFNQDGDAAGFYDTARKMMEENLRNSYGREVAKWNTISVLVFFTTKKRELDNG